MIVGADLERKGPFSLPFSLSTWCILAVEKLLILFYIPSLRSFFLPLPIYTLHQVLRALFINVSKLAGV